MEMIRNVQIIENWYLKVRYDPNYAYCRRMINNDYNNLYNNDIVQKLTN